MNVNLLISRVLQDPMTEIKPSQILTMQEINKDPYLITAYYNKSPYVRLVTPTHLIAEEINGVKFPRVERNKDIPDYAYDMVMEQGRALLFLEKGSGYAILKQFDEKRFLSFGKQRSVPFGIENFIQPVENELKISVPFRFGFPILIVEGLRDCLDAQTIYPYTLAMQTSGIPSMVKEVLQTLTNTLIIGLDDDEAGRKGANYIQKYSKFQCHRLCYPNGYKDIGTLSQLYRADSFSYDYFRSNLITQIAILVKPYLI